MAPQATPRAAEIRPMALLAHSHDRSRLRPRSPAGRNVDAAAKPAWLAQTVKAVGWFTLKVALITAVLAGIIALNAGFYLSRISH